MALDPGKDYERRECSPDPLGDASFPDRPHVHRPSRGTIEEGKKNRHTKNMRYFSGYGLGAAGFGAAGFGAGFFLPIGVHH